MLGGCRLAANCIFLQPHLGDYVISCNNKNVWQVVVVVCLFCLLPFMEGTNNGSVVAPPPPLPEGGIHFKLPTCLEEIDKEWVCSNLFYSSF